MVDLPTVYAATVTTTTWLVADGTNSPASRRPSIWNSTASRLPGDQADRGNGFIRDPRRTASRALIWRK